MCRWHNGMISKVKSLAVIDVIMKLWVVCATLLSIESKCWIEFRSLVKQHKFSDVTKLQLENFDFFMPDFGIYFRYLKFNIWFKAMGEFNPENDVFFVLYTSNSKNLREIISPNKTELTNTFFNTSNPTRIIIHGWLEDYAAESCMEIKNAYLFKNNFNVVSAEKFFLNVISNFF